jgi:hypothetical protein
MYNQSNAQPGSAQEPQGAPQENASQNAGKDDNVTDVDFEEVK